MINRSVSLGTGGAFKAGGKGKERRVLLCAGEVGQLRC